MCGMIARPELVRMAHPTFALKIMLNIILSANEVNLVGEWLFIDGKVIGDQVCQRIEKLVANHLDELAHSPGGWSILYQDPMDGRFWERTYPQGHLQGGGPPALNCIGQAEANLRYTFTINARSP